MRGVKVGVLMFSDGRDCESGAHESLVEHLSEYHDMVEVCDDDHKLGYAGAVQEGWERVRKRRWDYIFHAELDFVYGRRVPVGAMIDLLEWKPYLAQVCLKRQAVNEIEQAAGGVVEVNPDAYEQRMEAGFVWTEHRVCFSTNPSVYSTRLIESVDWPQCRQSEGILTHQLLEDPFVKFAFWGAKYAEPWVEHVGAREGVGY